MAHFLYCIMAERDVFKFGISASPVQRFQAIQNAHYAFLYLVFAAEFPDEDSAYKVEQHIFRKLLDYRARGEWVRYDVNLLDLLDYLAKKAIAIHFYNNGNMPDNEFFNLSTKLLKESFEFVDIALKAASLQLTIEQVTQAERQTRCLMQYMDIMLNTFHTKFDSSSVQTFINQPTHKRMRG